ncbi:MAG: DUF1549 domain-containing protein [Pirellulaceae bacterium]
MFDPNAGHAFQETKTESNVENLLKNGGFENSDPSANSANGWSHNNWSGVSDFRIVGGEGRNGSIAAKIVSQAPADASWSMRVKVKPNTDYQFSAWIKTESVETANALGVLLNVHELQMEGKSEALKGTNDWTQIVTEFNSSNHETLLLNCLFGGWGQATGQAWFDDVSLTEMSSPSEMLTEEEAAEFYISKVQPILEDNCLYCHGEDPEDLGGNLALTSVKNLLSGGESGPAVNLENHQASLMIKAINYDLLEMPPDEKLSAEDIAVLTRWVKLGLPWPEDEQTEITTESSAELVTEEAKQWWSFQPPVKSELPKVENADWCQNEIDYFVLARLEAAGMEPAEKANRRSLIRRAYYDLIGLPPTFEQVQAFVNDQDENAFEKVVDELLASPHYGEKWARHWLDLVRYAESNSFERDGTKPYVWRYRDYIIQSLNDDKPYDQFLIEQLAGDELSNPTPESLIATGYYRLGQWDDEPADPEQARFDDLDDILATTSQTMLGLTVNCARCHEHKIDPIPQEDYYRMLAFFSNIRRYGVRSWESVADASLRTIDVPEFANANLEIKQQIESVEKQIGEIETKAKADFIPVEHEEFVDPAKRRGLVEKRIGKVITQEEFDSYLELGKQRRKLGKQLADQQLNILCVKEHGSEPMKTHVMIRGNAHVEGAEVEPGFISVLSPPEPEYVAANGESTSSGRRLAFAKWVASGENPMTARVMANRIWQFHFGRGIVRTTSDFGFQGLPPTHPELLDWLASSFVDGGWKLKSLHRKIMLSSSYQMSSEFNADHYAADPQNDLLWRFDMRRLMGEEIRDAVLFTNGSLNLSMYGKSVYPELPAEVLAGQSMPGNGWETSPAEQQNRRSVYVHVKRSVKVPILTNFDAPDGDFTCPVRFVTTQPTQALNMINSEFMQQQAAVMLASIDELEELELETIVDRLFQCVCQRHATEEEVKLGVKTVNEWIQVDQLERRQAIQNLCLLMFNLNEFVYLD